MADRYASFAALAAGETRGIDYDFSLEDRGTSIVVLAPHGGWIEPGTSEIAREIAGDDYSIYVFEGLKPGRPHSDLHITSSRFDEPQALGLIGAAETAIAIHGRADRGDPETVRMGGLNMALRDAIASALQAAGFEASVDQLLPGLDPSNICNRGTTGGGVQLELPRTLRDRLVDDSLGLQSFGGAVREAMSISIA